MTDPDKLRKVADVLDAQQAAGLWGTSDRREVQADLRAIADRMDNPPCPWNPVSSGLPPVRHQVIVFIDGPTFVGRDVAWRDTVWVSAEAGWSSVPNWTTGRGGRWQWINVTHWAELPGFPNDRKIVE